jgi:hypothetical protein
MTGFQTVSMRAQKSPTCRTTSQGDDCRQRRVEHLGWKAGREPSRRVDGRGLKWDRVHQQLGDLEEEDRLVDSRIRQLVRLHRTPGGEEIPAVQPRRRAGPLNGPSDGRLAEALVGAPRRVLVQLREIDVERDARHALDKGPPFAVQSGEADLGRRQAGRGMRGHQPPEEAVEIIDHDPPRCARICEGPGSARRRI